MLALLVDQGIHLRDIPQPQPAAGEALLKVSLTGICRTDQEIARGYMAFKGIPGHEFVGEVVEINDASTAVKQLLGQRVVGEINCGCGNCAYCGSGLERHCPQRTVLGIAGRDGACAEYLTLPIQNLHQVPDSISDQAAVFTEPLAAALEIFEQTLIAPAERILVIGDGKLGILICQVLQMHGCRVVCVGNHAEKLDLLRGWGVNAVQRSVYQPEPYDVVVEASGSPEGFATALRSVKPRGTIILKSTYHGSLTLNAAVVVINEITVLGSRCGRFAPALRLLEQGLIPVESLITKIYPAAAALAAFQHAAQPEALKILLDFGAAV